MNLNAAALRSLGARDAEFHLEEWAERKSDRIDRQFLSGEMSKAEYERQMKEVGEIVERLWREAFP